MLGKNNSKTWCQLKENWKTTMRLYQSQKLKNKNSLCIGPTKCIHIKKKIHMCNKNNDMINTITSYKTYNSTN